MSDLTPLKRATSSQLGVSLEDWQRVADDAVVTRDTAGLPASLFRDDAWNVAAYGTNARHLNIHFRRHAPAGARQDIIIASTRQWKQVMYFLMHGVPDDVPAPNTLKQRMTELRAFTYYAAERQLTLYQALGNTTTILEYISEDGNETTSQRLHAILVHLHRLGKLVTGLHIPLRQLHGPMLERHAEREDSLQHPVIPTRVYQHFLETCERELRMVEAVAPELERQLGQAYAGKPISASAALSNAAEHFGSNLDMPGLSSFVMEIYALCQVLILAFTGMRGAEGQNLPYACLKTFRQDGVEHYTIEGVTTKLNGGRVKRASWVTSHLAVRAVKLAQRLSGVVHRAHGAGAYPRSSDGKFLLFSRLGLFGGEYMADRGPDIERYYIDRLRQRAFPAITQEDIVELKLIDPHRAWEAEPDFAVGARWPFTRHQLRRTLALYAQRSGLVSLPSLKRQLQHITQEMSMYYARGSAFAKDFLGNDKDHFAHDWADAQSVSEYLAYAAQVLFSDERLFGGHGVWATSRAVQQSPVSVYSREETLLMFKKGQLAYKETPLGGCANTEECTSPPLDWLDLECLEKNCKNLILAPSKLQRVVKAQERRVKNLRVFAAGSVEYRMEVGTLETLLATQEKINTRRET